MSRAALQKRISLVLTIVEQERTRYLNTNADTASFYSEEVRNAYQRGLDIHARIADIPTGQNLFLLPYTSEHDDTSNAA